MLLICRITSKAMIVDDPANAVLIVIFPAVDTFALFVRQGFVIPLRLFKSLRFSRHGRLVCAFMLAHNGSLFV